MAVSNIIKNAKGRLYISMYHYIRDLKNSRYPNIKGLDVNMFRQQLEFFKSNFHVVQMEQVIETIRGGGSPCRKTHCC